MILTIINNLLVVLTLHIYNSSVFVLKDISKGKLITGWVVTSLIFSSQTLFDNSLFFYNMFSFLIPFLVMSFWAYEGSVKRHLFFVFLFYIFALVIDVFVYSVLKNFVTEEQVSSITVDARFTIIYNIIILASIRIFSMIIKGKEKYEIKVSDWIEVFFVPLGSIFLVIWCFVYKSSNNTMLDFIGLIIITLLKVMSYFTYAKMEEKTKIQYRAGLLENQNQCYIEETKRITNLWDKINSFEHDYKYLFSEVVKNNDGQGKEIVGFGNRVASSGNFVVDSIINSRATTCETDGIDFRVNLKIPMDVKFYEDDLSILLCNLLDNAIEANSKLTSERWIAISICTDIRNLDTLLITISNPYTGTVKKNMKGEYLTSKVDKAHHGIGLQSVKNIVKKHNGVINIKDENEVFRVDIMLFNTLQDAKMTK